MNYYRYTDDVQGRADIFAALRDGKVVEAEDSCGGWHTVRLSLMGKSLIWLSTEIPVPTLEQPRRYRIAIPAPVAPGGYELCGEDEAERYSIVNINYDGWGGWLNIEYYNNNPRLTYAYCKKVEPEDTVPENDYGIIAAHGLVGDYKPAAPEPDWRNVPEGFKWIAMDANGLAFGYCEEPIRRGAGEWEPSWASDYRKMLTGAPDQYDWKKSKWQRPEEAEQGAEWYSPYHPAECIEQLQQEFDLLRTENHAQETINAKVFAWLSKVEARVAKLEN